MSAPTKPTDAKPDDEAAQPTDQQAATAASFDTPSGYVNGYPQPIAVLLTSDDPKAEPIRAVIQPNSQIPGSVDPVDLDRLVTLGYARPATA